MTIVAERLDPLDNRHAACASTRAVSLIRERRMAGFPSVKRDGGTCENSLSYRTAKRNQIRGERDAIVPFGARWLELSTGDVELVCLYHRGLRGAGSRRAFRLAAGLIEFRKRPDSTDAPRSGVLAVAVSIRPVFAGVSGIIRRQPFQSSKHPKLKLPVRMTSLARRAPCVHSSPCDFRHPVTRADRGAPTTADARSPLPGQQKPCRIRICCQS